LPCIVVFSIQDQRESSKTEKCINDLIPLMKGNLVIEENNGTSNGTKDSTIKTSNKSSYNVVGSNQQ